MSTIWKFRLTMVSDQDVEMPCGPSGIHLLYVALQGGALTLWARVEPNYPYRRVRVHIRGTGHPMDEAEIGAEYVGSCMSASEALVWHVWAQTNDKVRAR